MSNWEESCSDTEKLAPRVLPFSWREVKGHKFIGKFYVSTKGLLVMLSAEYCKEADTRTWLHVSVSRESRLPSWQDLQEVKDMFIGKDKKAFQVLPPSDEYVNHHPYVLHLWHCLGDAGIPDFRREGSL